MSSKAASISLLSIRPNLLNVLPLVSISSLPYPSVLLSHSRMSSFKKCVADELEKSILLGPDGAFLDKNSTLS